MNAVKKEAHASATTRPKSPATTAPTLPLLLPGDAILSAPGVGLIRGPRVGRSSARRAHGPSAQRRAGAGSRSPSCGPTAARRAGAGSRIPSRGPAAPRPSCCCAETKAGAHCVRDHRVPRPHRGPAALPTRTVEPGRSPPVSVAAETAREDRERRRKPRVRPPASCPQRPNGPAMAARPRSRCCGGERRELAKP
jgi:hypothetical protein